MNYTEDEQTLIDEIKEIVKEQLLREFCESEDFIKNIYSEIDKLNKYLEVKYVIMFSDGNIKLEVEFSNTGNLFEYDISAFSIMDTEENSKTQELIDYCEPWRKTNPTLAANEDELRKRCNEATEYKSDCNTIGDIVMIVFGIVSLVAVAILMIV